MVELLAAIQAIGIFAIVAIALRGGRKLGNFEAQFKGLVDTISDLKLELHVIAGNNIEQQRVIFGEQAKQGQRIATLEGRIRAARNLGNKVD
jgi:hypothetical protein